MQKKQSTKSGAKRIARIALFTALTAAGAAWFARSEER